MSGEPIVVAIEDVASTGHAHGERYAAQYASIAQALGLSKLGCRLVTIPPGKRGWPLHFHYVNEEMFFILSGSGVYRYGDQEFPVRPGHMAGARAGDRQGHQLVNTGIEPLRYLALSTQEQPDVFEYPETGKFGTCVGAAPGAPAEQRLFSIFARKDSAVDYWDGES